MSRGRARLALVLYLLAAAALTLGPLPERLLDLLIVCVRQLGDLPDHPTDTWVERSANVLFFMPLGILLCRPSTRLSPLGVWLACATLSTTVEVAQAVFLPERTPSLIDIATNSLGAALGVLLHYAMPPARLRLGRHRLPRRARRANCQRLASSAAAGCHTRRGWRGDAGVGRQGSLRAAPTPRRAVSDGELADVPPRARADQFA